MPCVVSGHLHFANPQRSTRGRSSPFYAKLGALWLFHQCPWNPKLIYSGSRLLWTLDSEKLKSTQWLSKDSATGLAPLEGLTYSRFIEPSLAFVSRGSHQQSVDTGLQYFPCCPCFDLCCVTPVFQKHGQPSQWHGSILEPSLEKEPCGGCSH